MKCLNPLNRIFYCLADEGVVKCAPEPKLQEIWMKCLNPQKKKKKRQKKNHCLASGVGCQIVHMNQSCRKFDEMPKSTKNFFSLFGQWGGGLGGGGCQNVQLNQIAGI